MPPSSHSGQLCAWQWRTSGAAPTAWIRPTRSFRMSLIGFTTRKVRAVLWLCRCAFAYCCIPRAAAWSAVCPLGYARHSRCGPTYWALQYQYKLPTGRSSRRVWHDAVLLTASASRVLCSCAQTELRDAPNTITQQTHSAEHSKRNEATRIEHAPVAAALVLSATPFSWPHASLLPHARHPPLQSTMWTSLR